MDSKVIIAIVVVAALVIGGGAALMFAGGSNEDSKDVVIYYGNGGVDDQGKDKIESKVATVLPNLFTNGEKVFTGWNTQKDGKGTTYKVDDPVKMGTKLYAQWGNYKLTIENIGYVALGLSAYITDDTRSMEKISNFTVPLSDSKSAMVTFAMWDEVQLEGETFKGKVNGFNTFLTIKVSGDTYHQYKVSDDGKMAMIYFEYNGNVVFQ